jgi:hypothetical protein
MFLRLCLSWLRRLLRLKRNDPMVLNAGILIIGSLFVGCGSSGMARRAAQHESI